MESFFKQQRGPSVSITLDLGLLEAGTMLALLNHIITNSLILHGFLILIHGRKKKNNSASLTNIIGLFTIKLRVKNHKVS